MSQSLNSPSLNSQSLNSGGLRPAVAGLSIAVLLAATSLICGSNPVVAEQPEPRPLPGAETVEMFQAIADGKIDVKLTVKNGEEARVVARNLTDRPLTIEPPDGFAAVPILAQNQGGGGDLGNFNLPPEKFASQKVGFVCLEHGKPNPRRDMQYEIKPIDTLTDDPRVVTLLVEHGNGRCSHAVAQAAAWHLQNGMSWQQLAAKRRTHLGGGSEPYFTPQQLRGAVQMVNYLERTVDKEAAEAEPATVPESTRPYHRR
ncbi:MAG: hypothetical protein DWQ31_01775 [Planctomycetota bacterium]|nr:MAG: hypothetical protein DWQ31_01775 [Planctomycetota bacterium]REJ87191.1 MAG: hypothetical protein DWQ35_21845 [Planctomycetota bacterium]REK23845.1 MAG: hypothetical protein DWQ42_14330 [Planctomycetota bacterium]REK44719.1 MAG: hypothetical protein DWQ46_08755 [Planctomycetota bacterium]